MTTPLHLADRPQTLRLLPARRFYLLGLATIVAQVATAPISIYLGAITFGVGVFFVPGLITVWLSRQVYRFDLPTSGRIASLVISFLLVPAVLLYYVVTVYRTTGTFF